MLTRKALLTETRLKGCSLSKPSIEELERYIRSHQLVDQYKEVVRVVCDKLKEAGCTGPITPEMLQHAINAVNAQEKAEDRIFIISANAVPKFSYDANRGVFCKCSTKSTISGCARDKAQLYRDRYELLMQRVLRYDLFVKPSFDMKLAKSKLEMSSISSLDGTCSGKNVTVMGMLYRRDDDVYVLEDSHNSVVVNLDNVKYTAGLFVEGSFVVAQGQYTDGIYHLSGVGFPPAEPRDKSLAAASHNVDFFGLADQQGTKEEEAHCSATFIILADVFLSDPKVVMKLRSLFNALATSEDPSLLHFLLVGNFTEAPFHYGDCSSFVHISQSEKAKYTLGFDRLADLIAEFPSIASKSQFTIVPGPHDPTPGGFILPQPPIPNIFISNLRRKVAKLTMSTNPCRVRFFSQEIVLFRDDLYRKARRHCLPSLPPQASEESYNHLVKTIVDQAHLSPVPLTVTPVYWTQDHALRLFPLPHLVVMCDTGESWETEYMGCTFLNPGSFSRNQTFLIHRPASGQHQFQQMR